MAKMLITPSKADSTSYLARPEHTAKTSTAPVVNSLSSTKLHSYPVNYYVSFGQKDTNLEIFRKMKDTLKTSKDRKKQLRELHKLFNKLSEVPRNNCLEFVRRFEKEGLTLDDYLITCARKDRLFYHSPEKLESNIRGFVKVFEDKGLTVEKYLKLCLNAPALISEKPENIISNIKGVAARFTEEGLTEEKYLAACFKRPTLLYQRPYSIEGNIRKLVGKFHHKGLTATDYVNACLKDPALFYYSPETIEKSVKAVLRHPKIRGLNPKDFIRCCVKAPVLFRQVPDLTIEHINTLLFCNKNAENPLKPRAFWTKITTGGYVGLLFSSPYTILKKLLLPQMHEDGQKPPELRGDTKLPEKLRAFFKKYPDRKYTLKIKGTTEEIALLNEYIRKLLPNIENPYKIIRRW